MRVMYGEVFKLHDPSGIPHTERPERLERALRALEPLREHLKFVEPAKGRRDIVERIHERAYVELIEEESRHREAHMLDPDTYVSPETFTAAAAAVTSAHTAAKASVATLEPYLVLARPPGHHAGRAGRALGAPTLGFCIFNNAAAAVLGFREAGKERVAVIDFDAHHGNGTQEIFWEDPGVLHIDVHEGGIYPGTGSVEDVGGGMAAFTKVNVPMPHGAGDPDVEEVIEDVIIPAVERFSPDAIVVSAGFDGHHLSPMAWLRYTSNTFYRLGALIKELAERYCEGAFVAVLEGGYERDLEIGLRSFVEGVLGLKLSHEEEVTRRAGLGHVLERVREVVRKVPKWA